MNNLKINLHITERCNFKCRYCFAYFKHRADLPLENWKKIIDDLKVYGNISAINFAGGEPILYKDFPELIDYARNLDFKVSIISNGSLLLDEKFAPADIFSRLDTLGISVDSFDEKILIKLGRCDGSFRILSKEKFLEIIERAKSVNPSIKIKINTVVSQLNKNERLTEIENCVEINRWKFLNTKLFETENFSNRNLLVSDEEFQKFIEQNPRKNGESVLEKKISRSYIMIDNVGNMLDDFGEDYEIVGNILEENFSDVFGRFQLDKELYQSRYI